jgi:acetyl/propionyl-CoA carboxylase alpha subunit
MTRKQISQKKTLPTKVIKRLFIANRGEICRRIAVTANRLGIETVALTDRQAPPAFLLGIVTEFVHVPEEAPALYLDSKKMIELAKQARCDAVHPGFGFLSENAAFAASCEAAGLTWIGPHSAAIEAMASKATARIAAENAAVPCIKGLNGFPVPRDVHGDFSVLENFAEEAGYPLLLKAALGGGGKGMRLVHDKKQLREAALRAFSEAQNSFGDGRLICERYLGAPRHVEVQILADKHGNVFAIGDRDCSLQRRHQKIIEEAPAPELSQATREAMHAAAVKLAAGVSYDNAGTVEFLVDWSDDARKSGRQDFFFLEMNTRLQVEHPVTEEVYGLDLVEWQLRIAQGEALPPAFGEIAPRGHSIEVRIYAEDVNNDYFPSPGPIAAFLPASGPGVRWEVGIDPVDEVTGLFDPMVAKLVATGSDRPEAMDRMAQALERTLFAGPKSNIDLLIELTRRSSYRDCPVTTHFLTTELKTLLGQIQNRYDALKLQFESLKDSIELALADGDNQLGSLTIGAKSSVTAAAVTLQAFSNGKIFGNNQNHPHHEKLGFSLVQSTLGVQGGRLVAGVRSGKDGKSNSFWYASLKTTSTRRIWLKIESCHFTEVRASRRSADGSASETEGSHELVAPVPGKVIAIKAKAGDEVEKNLPVLILESMKMEFEVKAPKTGKISALHVKIGDQVAAGQQLAAWEK